MTQSRRPDLDDLPLLATVKQAAAVMGPTERQVRDLARTGRLGYVMVGKRIMIPRDAIQQFVPENTVPPCRDETQEHAFVFSSIGAASTSAGPKMEAIGSAQRVRKIASKLKSLSPSSSTCEPGASAPVIPLKR
jgi:excisionase family DNA binding protein